MTRSTASFRSWNQSLNLECDFKNVCNLHCILSPLVLMPGAKMEVKGFSPPPPRPTPTIVRIQPDVAVLRFACNTCMLSTSRIFCFFVFLRGWGVGCLLVVFVVVVVVVVLFLCLCAFFSLFFPLFFFFCVLYTWYVHVYNHTICNGSSGLLQ